VLTWKHYTDYSEGILDGSSIASVYKAEKYDWYYTVKIMIRGRMIFKDSFTTKHFDSSKEAMTAAEKFISGVLKNA